MTVTPYQWSPPMLARMGGDRLYIDPTKPENHDLMAGKQFKGIRPPEGHRSLKVLERRAMPGDSSTFAVWAVCQCGVPMNAISWDEDNADKLIHSKWKKHQRDIRKG